MSAPARGEVWWGEAPDAKGRPYLVSTRDEAIPVLQTILVAPVTRTIRGIPTEVPVGAEEGLPTDGVASMDNVLAFPKLSSSVGWGRSSGPSERACEALRAATDC